MLTTEYHLKRFGTLPCMLHHWYNFNAFSAHLCVFTTCFSFINLIVFLFQVIFSSKMLNLMLKGRVQRSRWKSASIFMALYRLSALQWSRRRKQSKKCQFLRIRPNPKRPNQRNRVSHSKLENPWTLFMKMEKSNL